MQFRITDKQLLQNLQPDANDFLTAWLLKESGNKAGGDRIMKELSDKNPNAKNIQWCVAVYTGSLERAKTLAKEIDMKDQRNLFMGRVVDELLHLGSYCCQP